MSLTPALSPHTIVTFLPLTTQPANWHQLYLTNLTSQRTVLIHRRWLPLIPYLNRSHSIRELAQLLYHDQPQNFPLKSTQIHLIALINHLAEHGLVSKINSHQLIEPILPPTFTHLIYPKHLRWFFQPPMICLYLLLSLTAIFLPRFYPQLSPQSFDYFWHASFTISFCTAFILTSIFGFFHELAHLATAYRFGVGGQFNFSHRLNFLVFETSFPRIYSLTRLQRLSVLSSGVIFDLITITFAYLPLIIHSTIYPIGHPSFIALIKQFILLQWLSVLWQFLFYMKTDIYYILKEIFAVENLYTYAVTKIKYLLRGQSLTLRLDPRDRLFINLYAVFFVLGTLVGLFRYGVYQLPITISLIYNSAMSVGIGLTNRDWLIFSDGATVLLIEAVMISLFIFSHIKSRPPSVDKVGVPNRVGD